MAPSQNAGYSRDSLPIVSRPGNRKERMTARANGAPKMPNASAPDVAGDTGEMTSSRAGWRRWAYRITIVLAALVVAALPFAY